MKNIITLTGNLASGKGTISKLLQERLGYEIYRNGDYFRSLGKQMGMDVTTFNKYVEEHPDEYIIEWNEHLEASPVFFHETAYPMPFEF